MEVWRPPHDMPHLLEWWRPLMLVARRARAERVPWPIHLDEFNLVGRVVRHRDGRPDLWVYEHHGSRATIHADATGQAYRFFTTPRGPGIGQFRPCGVRQAVYGAGLHQVVEPVRYQSRESGRAGHRQEGGGRAGVGDAAVGGRERGGVGGRERVGGGERAGPGRGRPARRRGHLRVYDGQVEAS